MTELLDHEDLSVIEEIGISHIDVSNHSLRIDSRASEVSLVTEVSYSDTDAGGVSRPVVIRWGRSRNHRLGAIELSVTTKLRNLASVLKDRPALSGVQVVDVRFDPPHWR